MRSERPSSTSEATTAVRAREMFRPPEDRICCDPYAVHFLSPFYQVLRKHRVLGVAFGWIKERICPGIRGGILARTRYIDERVNDALREGIEQVVILGAGFDSRAYRLIDPGAGVAVFEVDHPATQRVKIVKVMELFGRIPGHVFFVAVDFCRDDLGRQLRAAGYDAERKTLFICEGVTYYLDAADVDRLLGFVIRNSGSGSSIAFDCFPPPVVDGSSPLREARSLRRRVARSGEPFRFGIDESEIVPFLQLRGFQHITITGARECKEAWFRGANQGVKVSEIFQFVHATHHRVQGGATWLQGERGR